MPKQHRSVTIEVCSNVAHQLPISSTGTHHSEAAIKEANRGQGESIGWIMTVEKPGGSTAAGDAAASSNRGLVADAGCVLFSMEWHKVSTHMQGNQRGT